MKIIRYFIESSLKFVDFWGQGFLGFRNGTIEDLQSFVQTQTTHYSAKIVTIEDLDMAKVNFVFTISSLTGNIIDTSFINKMPLEVFIDRFFGIEFNSINVARLQLTTIECILSEVNGELPTKEELQSIVKAAGIKDYTFDPSTNVCHLSVTVSEQFNDIVEVVDVNGIISPAKPSSTKIWEKLKSKFLTMPTLQA